VPLQTRKRGIATVLILDHDSHEDSDRCAIFEVGATISNLRLWEDEVLKVLVASKTPLELRPALRQSSLSIRMTPMSQRDFCISMNM
jgi:hypothetical protein